MNFEGFQYADKYAYSISDRLFHNNALVESLTPAISLLKSGPKLSIQSLYKCIKEFQICSLPYPY